MLKREKWRCVDWNRVEVGTEGEPMETAIILSSLTIS